MQFQSLLIIISTLSTVLALTITENTITNPPYTFPAESVTVDKNVFWSFLNVPRFKFTNDIIINGEFYVSNNESIAITETPILSQINFINTGTMSFTGVNYGSYAFSVALFNNTGDMFFANTNDDAVSAYIYAPEWSNSGSITIKGPFLASNFEVNDGSGREPILNMGDIYLDYAYFRQENSILGAGCFHLQSESIIRFHNPGEHMSQQTFYMTNPRASLYIETEPNVGTNIIVAGFGNGNSITTSNTISRFAYNEANDGNLIIYIDNVEYIFSVGLGYDVSKFTLDAEATTLIYTGIVPNPVMPTNCKPAPPIPIAPQELPQSSSSIGSSSTEASSTNSISSETSESVSVSSSITSSGTISSITSSIISSSIESNSNSATSGASSTNDLSTSIISSSIESISKSTTSSASSINDMSSSIISSSESLSSIASSETSISSSDTKTMTSSSESNILSTEISSSITSAQTSSDESSSSSPMNTSKDASSSTFNSEISSVSEASTSTEVSSTTEPDSRSSNLSTWSISGISFTTSSYFPDVTLTTYLTTVTNTETSDGVLIPITQSAIVIQTTDSNGGPSTTPHNLKSSNTNDVTINNTILVNSNPGSIIKFDILYLAITLLLNYLI